MSAIITCKVAASPELATAPERVREPDPALSVKVVLAVAVIPPVTAIGLPGPVPPPVLSPALLSVTFVVIVSGLPIVRSPAVRIVPDTVTELGAEAVSEPNTINVSFTSLLMTSAPVFKKDNAYAVDPDVPIVLVLLLPLLSDTA